MELDLNLQIREIAVALLAAVFILTASFFCFAVILTKGPVFFALVNSQFFADSWFPRNSFKKSMFRVLILIWWCSLWGFLYFSFLKLLFFIPTEFGGNIFGSRYGVRDIIASLTSGLITFSCFFLVMKLVSIQESFPPEALLIQQKINLLFLSDDFQTVSIKSVELLLLDAEERLDRKEAQILKSRWYSIFLTDPHQFCVQFPLNAVRERYSQYRAILVSLTALQHRIKENK